jgi:DNA-directed RNA polymerase subunit RPC12/RpoP
MKREHCSQCGELVWVEEDIRPHWTPSRNCPHCASRIGIERLRAEREPESRKEKEAA